MNAQLSPRVSVIIPAYNSERYIGESLQSVVDQTYRDYEVIVVDDGSTDNTKARALAVHGPINYIQQSNQGPAAARNTGIDAARGELICFLDADDSWASDKLQAQVEFIDRNPGVGLVFSDEKEFDDVGVTCVSLLSKSAYHAELTAGSILKEPFQKLLQENFIPTSTVMARTACFKTTGLFDVALRGPEDRDMWSRIAVYFPIACIPRVLGAKRVVASSVSRDVETTLRSRIRLWTKARTLFPELTPVRTVNALLAPTYVQLGFVLLRKNKAGEARALGWKALRVSRDPYESFLAASLVFFSFTGRAFADSMFRTKRWLLSSRHSPTAS
jgi:glycosyltransferase involved in cell wall biosynthesis